LLRAGVESAFSDELVLGHGTMVPLHFLTRLLKRIKSVVA
jgi:hypothetical protein